MPILHSFLLLFLLGALLAPGIYKYFKQYTGYVVALIPASLFIWTLYQFPNIQSGHPLINSFVLVDSLHINMTFKLDGLSQLFVLVISGIGTLIVLYAVAYFQGAASTGQFLSFMLLFSTAMLGLVLSDDVISLFLCWEGTSFTSYLLIAFEYNKVAARQAAWRALLVTATGGLGLLIGFLLLGYASGTYSLTAMMAMPALQAHPLMWAAMTCILLGMFTKSAQYPFHLWLPGAMAAPTPVSAYLHSATMVQGGVYLAFRLYPLFHTAAYWNTALLVVGGISTVVAGLKAVSQRDLKGILAYATISALGMIFFLTGMGTAMALQAAILFMVLHAAYKGGLFMAVGIIDKSLHTRSFNTLQGLRYLMPITTAAVWLLAASNAGVFPFLGFIGKEVIYTSTLSYPMAALTTAVCVLGNAGIIATAFMVGGKPFFGKPATPTPPVKLRADFYCPPLLLGIVGLVAGLWPQFVNQLIHPVLQTIVPREITGHLALWHGATGAFGLSMLSLLLAVGFYLGRRYFKRIDLAVTQRMSWDAVYKKIFSSLLFVARLQDRWFQHGYLKWYLFTAFAFLIALAIPGVMNLTLSIELTWHTHFYVYFTLILMVISGFVSIRAKSILMSLAALGGVGFFVTLVFVFMGAPDLAITQFAIETLTVILFILVAYQLPTPSMISSRGIVVLDIVLSVLAGGLVTALLLSARTFTPAGDLQQFFNTHTYELLHAHNVVNAIITEFRAIDTLGETMVIAMAGLGVYTLLKSHTTKQNKL